MKKLVTAMSLLLGLGLASAQQTHPAAASHPAAPAKVVKADHQKKEMPAAAQTDKKTKTVAAKSAVAAKPVSQTHAKPMASSGMKMKKDGTPDKRYKENKHLKKDGTPDKRYKTN
ncbi:MAG: hypothetical protein KJ689_07035 [Bacteroidetes bacterium]|nr:hypothetical protein [Bacteroidota bacterium]